jgi:hypothetical protein
MRKLHVLALLCGLAVSLSSLLLASEFLMAGLSVVAYALINIITEYRETRKRYKESIGKLTPLNHLKIAEYVEKKEYREAIIYMLMEAYHLTRDEVLKLTPDEVKEMVSKIEYT